MTSQKVDFKKHPRAGYQAKIKPAIIELSPSQFIQVDGKGDPNTSADYQQAIELLYALSYAIKMSPKHQYVPNGYFDYVVPPLEGLWWLENDDKQIGMTLNKNQFNWRAMIRQPDFVTQEVFNHALLGTDKRRYFPICSMLSLVIIFLKNNSLFACGFTDFRESE